MAGPSSGSWVGPTLPFQILSPRPTSPAPSREAMVSRPRPSPSASSSTAAGKCTRSTRVGSTPATSSTSSERWASTEAPAHVGGAGASRPVGRQDTVPARPVGVAPRPAPGAEALPAPVLDVDTGGQVRELAEDDLDVGGVGWIGGDVPEIGDPPRRFPGGYLSPLDLLARDGAFEYPPPDAGLEDHVQVALRGHGVVRWPPGGGSCRPGRESVVCRAGHHQRQP